MASRIAKKQKTRKRAEELAKNCKSERDLQKIAGSGKNYGVFYSSVLPSSSSEDRQLSANGRVCGESHPKARMTDAEVACCFELQAMGFGTRRISKLMGHPRSTICDVLSCRTRSMALGFRKKR